MANTATNPNDQENPNLIPGMDLGSAQNLEQYTPMDPIDRLSGLRKKLKTVVNTNGNNSEMRPMLPVESSKNNIETYTNEDEVVKSDSSKNSKVELADISKNLNRQEILDGGDAKEAGRLGLFRLSNIDFTKLFNSVTYEGGAEAIAFNRESSMKKKKGEFGPN